MKAVTHASLPRRHGLRLAAAALALASAAASAHQGTEPVRWQLNLIPGVTATSHNAYHAHMIMLWICVVIGIAVFGAMGYAMFKFRKSKGAVPDTGFTHSTVLEAIWTILPIVILGRLGDPGHAHGDGAVQRRPRRHPAEMTIKVTGYQWMWRYEYVDRAWTSSAAWTASRTRCARAARPSPIRRWTTTCATWTGRWCCRPTRASASC
jgi:cytochrome c oxidase subunit 2